MKRTPLPVQPVMCATCPFREGVEHRYACLKHYLSKASMEATRICHSTGRSVFHGRTGKPRAICRGARDFQLQVFWRLGWLDEPTDEAWARQTEAMRKAKR